MVIILGSLDGKANEKNRFVKFWKHVAGHRANEIAYIYKKRNKPDYLGKIYRKILEPTCYLIGLFLQNNRLVCFI